jgi:hypothetical protein
MSMFPKDALDFYAGVSRLAARARERGDLDAQGDPIWSENEWKAFCRGVRSYSHLQSLGLGMAAYRTCVDVESWLASGMDAFDIHEALRDGGVEQEIHRLKQLESSNRRPVYHTAYLVEDDQT